MDLILVPIRLGSRSGPIRPAFALALRFWIEDALRTCDGRLRDNFLRKCPISKGFSEAFGGHRGPNRGGAEGG